MKHCAKCGDTKVVAEYNKCSAATDGLQAYCRSCCRVVAHGHNKTRTPRRGGERLLVHRYGLTTAARDQMLAEQNGACAICASDKHNGINWNVDHDHSCCSGRKSCGLCVRGILCAPCNHHLGFIEKGVSPMTPQFQSYLAIHESRIAAA